MARPRSSWSVHAGAEARVEPVLRFLLSPRAAFVSGQPIAVDAHVPRQARRRSCGRSRARSRSSPAPRAASAKRPPAAWRAKGARVVCLDRPADDARAAEVAHAIGGELLAFDLTDGGAPAAVAAHLRERHGGVDIVVHNAGVTRDRTLARMPAEQWDRGHRRQPLGDGAAR